MAEPTAEPNGSDEMPQVSAEYQAMDEFISKCETSSPEEWSKAGHET